ncbi:MAG: Ig-like domain-containing protein [Lachnospiraceae bacterium]|nr:Ig-like domain-containing protein [Lachnospiraceae bacterium]
MKRLKKKWKITIGIMIAVLSVGIGGLVYAVAANSIKIVIGRDGEVLQFATDIDSMNVYIGLAGKDENGNTDYTRIFYASTNERIFDVLGYGNDEGSLIEVMPVSAGIAQLEAKYWLSGDLDDDPEFTRPVYANITVPLVVRTMDDQVLSNDVIILEADNADVTVMTNATIHNAITWTYSNANVVTVESDTNTFETATIKVVGAGRTIVTGTTQDGVSTSFEVVVKPKLYYDNITLDANQSMSISDLTNVINANAVFCKTDLSPLGREIATIENGIIKGVYTGETVLYISSDPDFADDMTVKINIKVPFMWVEKIVTLNVGDTFKLQTSADPSTVTWVTSDADVLMLQLVNNNNDGTIVGVKEGMATVTAIRAMVDENGITTYESISTLINVVDTFSLDKTEVVINKDVEFSITALITNQEATLHWAIADENIVKFADKKTTKSGVTEKFIGLKKGETTIVVTQNINGTIKTATCKIIISEPVSTIRIDPDSLMIPVGQEKEVKLFFDPLNADNQNVRWTSTNPDVAIAEGDSLGAIIKGLKGGKTTIAAITEDGLQVAYCEVEVVVRVTDIELNIHHLTIDMATQFYQLTYKVYPNVPGVNQQVTWSSSNEDILKVDQNGLVEFVAPGYATVYCQTLDSNFDYGEGAPYDLCEFYIKKPVTEIVLNHTEEHIKIGDKLVFTAAVFPIDASNKNVIWSSSNENVVQIDQKGNMVAVGSGYAAILCQSEEDGITAVCNIYVRQQVTSVVISATEISVKKGQDFWLSAYVLPEHADNKAISWTSSNDTIAQVSPDGHVTTLATGTVLITAISDDTGVTATCQVLVTEPVTSITLNSSAERLLVGSKFALIPDVQPIDATNKNVIYTSSDPEIAVVDENGVITALKGGECVIIAKTEERGLMATCNITVIEKVSKIELDKDFTYVNINSFLKLNATVYTETATDKRILWTSSDDTIARVDQNGNIYGVNYGTAVITVTALDGGGASTSCIVQVIEPVKDIVIDKIDPETIEKEIILVGQHLLLKATIKPSNATVQKLKWESSDPTIATVDEDGEVTGVSPGKVKISATSTDGNNVTAYYTVYVIAVVNTTQVKIDEAEYCMLAGKSRQLKATMYPLNTTEELLWRSSDPSIVTVSETGVITTVGVGVAHVIAYSTVTGTEGVCTIYSMALSKTKLVMEQYDSFQLYVDGAPSAASFRSSNPRVATVTANGNVVAREPGTTTITATVEGKTMTCTVTVVDIEDNIN